ncbi:MAG: AmmeMemoRadiSam system protein A [Armatimonadetes bacterium]|nr:AmmeMemoRadiSam system protein A [Armatimonadota bacterium]
MQNKDLVNLARLAVEEYIKNGRIISPPEMLEGILKEKAGVFVCIKKKGDLRGCIGTLSPIKKNIAEEIIHNAISSAARDPRFFKVNEDELKELTFSIDVLKEGEKIKDLSELDPKKYGIIVKSGFKSGVLLPNLEGIDNIEKQIEIALSKAGISHKENYEIYRFEVKRYE